MANQSPKWNRPPKLLHIQKRKIITNVKNGHSPCKKSSTSCSSQGISVKRRNPFSAKTNFEDLLSSTRCHSNQLENDQSFLFSLLNSNKEFFQEESLDSFALSSPSYPATFQTEVLTSSCECENNASASISYNPSSKSSNILPTDWSLKTKIRFLTSNTLPCSINPKSCDEAKALDSFVSAPMSEVTSNTESAFLQSLHYWIFPSLPWARLFPRIESSFSIRSPNILDDNMKLSLKSDWSDSMTSAFHQLRNGFCSHFYVCCPQFTVLFISNFVNSQNELQAAVSPTTRGFRDALQAEGVSFSVPLEERVAEVNECDADLVHQKGEGEIRDTIKDVVTIDEETPGVWLESIGVSRKTFPSLDPSQVKLQRDNFHSIDNRPESCILVEGNEVQAFFNFLLNWRGCFAVSGFQAGLPPTILSSFCFKGATLHQLRYKQTSVYQDICQKPMNVVEVSGPVLPLNVLGLCRLFSAATSHFIISFVTHEPTSVFNRLSLNTLNSCYKNDSSGAQDGNEKFSTFRTVEFNGKEYIWT